MVSSYLPFIMTVNANDTAAPSGKKCRLTSSADSGWQGVSNFNSSCNLLGQYFA
jgi:hypothetical protein